MSYIDDPVRERRKTAEHEAAHAIVADAVGLEVCELRFGDENSIFSGQTTFAEPLYRGGDRSPDAVWKARQAGAVMIAPRVWFDLRWREYPEGENGCGSDFRRLLYMTDAIGQRDAAQLAAHVLRERSGDVLRLADDLLASPAGLDFRQWRAGRWQRPGAVHRVRPATVTRHRPNRAAMVEIGERMAREMAAYRAAPAWSGIY